MSQLFNIVQAHFAVENIGTKEQLSELKEKILEIYNNRTTNLLGTNDHCWRTTRDIDGIDWVKDEIMKLVSQMVAFYIQEDPTYKAKRDLYQDIEMNYWINVNETGSKNAIHNHCTDNYVACFYVQATDTGEIVFYNPGNLAEEYNQFSPFTSAMSYQPKDGDLVVWPAWVPHAVEENKSDKLRINIPFNIKFKVPTEERI